MKRKRGTGRRPKAYKRRRTYARKKVRRAKRAMGLSAKATLSGFPQSRICRLRYGEYLTMTPSLGFSTQFLNFAANGLFDPNLQVGGHQPLGFDQWTTFYNHYTVLGSKITVKFILNNALQATNYTPIACGVKLLDDATAVYSTGAFFDNLAERGFSYKIMVPNVNQVYPVRCVSKYSAKKFFNLKDVKDNNTRVGSPATGNPNELAVYQIYFGSLNGQGVSDYTMQCLVTIDYIVQWSEPKDLAQS